MQYSKKFQSVKENKSDSALLPENSLSGARVGTTRGMDFIYDGICRNNIGILKDGGIIILTQINKRTTTPAYRP
jgi:hypothetical protein